jgi:hypothetical protein
MEIPKFTRDEDKDEINPMEWLRLVKEYNMTPRKEIDFFFMNIGSGGLVLIKILDGTAHGNNLKNSSQINGSEIQKSRNCIEFKMN